jgi:hypothetical protein
MIVGEEARICSAIKFQISSFVTSDAAFTGPPIGWAIQYVPAGSNPQVCAFNQATSGTLVPSNQFILGAGVFQADNAPNAFYAHGHKLDDGDQIYMSLQSLSAFAITCNGIFRYTITTK